MKLVKVMVILGLCLATVPSPILDTSAATTPTFSNRARFSRGVGNACFWISSSASSYYGNVKDAAYNWEHTGTWDNPIDMTEVSSNNGTHIDVYAKTSAQDSVLKSTTAAYVSYWNNNSQLVASRGYGPSINYFYTEIAINKNNFPSNYRTSILIHEMGHAFGLAHNTNNKYSIMYPYYNTVLVSRVQKVDNDTILSLY